VLGSMTIAKRVAKVSRRVFWGQADSVGGCERTPRMDERRDERVNVTAESRAAAALPRRRNY